MSGHGSIKECHGRRADEIEEGMEMEQGRRGGRCYDTHFIVLLSCSPIMQTLVCMCSLSSRLIILLHSGLD